MAESLFEVWRRPRHSREAWRKIPGLRPMTQDEAFKATVAEEMKVSFTDWEYAIAAVGRSPSSRSERGGQPFWQGYRTKEMRPHGK